MKKNFRKLKRLKESYIVTKKSKIARMLFMLIVITIGVAYLVSMFYTYDIVQPNITNKLLGLGIILSLVSTIVYGSLILNSTESLKDTQSEEIDLHEITIEQLIGTKKLVKAVKKAIEQLANEDKNIIIKSEKEDM